MDECKPLIQVPLGSKKDFDALAAELSNVDELLGKFLRREPAGGRTVDSLSLPPNAALLGRLRGIPLVESHPRIVLEFATEVKRLWLAAREKLKRRRVPIWVAFLEGEMYFEYFPELKKYMDDVFELRTRLEARVAETVATATGALSDPEDPVV